MTFHRPARFMPPATPSDKVVLPVPPEVRQSQNNLMNMVLPLLTSLGIAGYMLAYGQRRLIALAILFAVVAVATTVGMRIQNKSNEKRATLRQRSRYRSLLSETRSRAREVASTQRMLAAWAHPAPDRLLPIAEAGRRVWERRQADPDFLKVRLGVGDAELSTPLQVGTRLDPMADYDWEALRAARKLVDRVGKVGGQPFVLDLATCGVLSILGPTDRRFGVARALLSQVAVLHAPDDVLIAVDGSGGREWNWTKWLPHTQEPERRGRAGVVPLVASGPEGIVDFLHGELERRGEAHSARRMQIGGDRNAAPKQQRLVVLFTSFDPKSEWGRSALLRSLLEAAGPQYGITLVFLGARESDEPARVDVRLRVETDGAVTLAGRTSLSVGAEAAGSVADRVERQLAELIARRLCPLTLNDEEDRRLARTVSFTETLLGPNGLEDDLTSRWVSHDSDRLLKVPIGTDGSGQLVVLDVKESAQGGSGPHGLIVGATGSGKSELLRTLVSGLALAHSPELLSFVMVDFKGGATFAQLTELPHVAGMITNLADDAALIERVQAALVGEQQRRQEMLRDAGNLDSIREYHLRRAAGSTNTDGSPLEPMPYLMIIIDEFAELLSSVPEFVDLFVQIGRVGRSLGMHLLLATQKLEEGRLRGLDSHLSYRICLRTFSAQESRIVIGTQDAYRLPPIPGSAYLKVDERIYQRLRVAHVSAPYVSPEERANLPGGPTDPVLFDLREGPPVEDGSEEEDGISPMAGPGERTQLNVMVERLRNAAQPTRQVWLPPLPPAVSLDLLIGPTAADPLRGYHATMWQLHGSLKSAIGVIDLPVQQLQQPLIVDFAGPHGHLAMVGAPRSGRSTALRTMMMTMMLTHTPDEVQFYAVDFGGESLHSFAVAPHVGGVAGRLDPDRVRRLIADVGSVIGHRERLFRELGIDSIAEFRSRRDAGRLPEGTRAADIFLLVDNWGSLRSEIDELEPVVTEIAVRGLGVGVHVVLTTNRWMEFRPALRDAIGTRMEFAINDPSDSDIARRMQKVMPKNAPGRALIPPGAFAHIVLPRLDGQDNDEGLRAAQDEALQRITAAWPGPGAPAVRMLPDRIMVSELPQLADRSPDAVPLGIGEPELDTVTLDLTGTDAHLLIAGDTASGKTELLRTWMRGLARERSAWEVRIVLVDYRRSLLGVVPEDHLGAYAADSNAARVYAEQVAEKLRERMPPPDVTPRQLKNRDWWEGPDIYVVVDDYDLMGGGGPTQSPLGPLMEFIPHARDVGLHLVLARRVAGMSRATMTDQLLNRIRELGCIGIVLSGDPREGYIIGTERAMSRPAGRGVLIRRGQPRALFQAALEDEDEYDDGGDEVYASSAREESPV
ncbi:type VII secretion protein EccCb [Virgisporangium aliadipatigenens]|nr:type VII secretion protein EccCb [Virgisporangium aliadipatigenens]